MQLVIELCIEAYSKINEIQIKFHRFVAKRRSTLDKSRRSLKGHYNRTLRATSSSKLTLKGIPKLVSCLFLRLS